MMKGKRYGQKEERILGGAWFSKIIFFGGGVFVWGWMEGWMWMWWRVGCVGLGGGLVSGGNVHGLCLGSVAITEPLTQSQTLNRNQTHTHTHEHAHKQG